MNTNLTVYNSLSRQLEKFEPLNPPFVGMYVCGPTVYSDVHIGNVRTFISFDIIYRYLIKLGYKVRYVRNITDVGHLLGETAEGEDRISKAAKLEAVEPMELVQKYTNGFHFVMNVFNTKQPNIEPTATGHIVEQIELVQTIIDKGLAYEKNGSVYFDVLKYNENEPYGELSGRVLEDLLEQTRNLDGQEDKKNAYDFAIWKKAEPEHVMQWKSPWGKGFPGWHLECTVMSTKYLGKIFDIHGGGMDLKFPHHECEIAQNKASYNCTPSKYWLHTNMLTLNGKKMSKSEGESFKPLDLIYGNNILRKESYSAMCIKFFMLQAHYRSTLDFSSEALNAAEKGFKKFIEGLKTLQKLKESDHSSFDINETLKACYNAMNDDFNTPKLIAVLYDVFHKVNNIAIGKETLNSNDLKLLQNEVTDWIENVLGIRNDEAENNPSNNEVIELLIRLRNDAKQQKNFALSDAIRDDLQKIGIQLKDGKEGTTYTFL